MAHFTGMKQKFALWSSRGTPSEFARCMNPRCTKRVEFRKQKSGRQKGFCDDACRVQANRDYETLVTALDNASTYGQNDPNFLSKIHWHLERYVERKPEPASQTEIEQTSKSSAPASGRKRLLSSADTVWLLPMLNDPVLAKALAGNSRTPGQVLSQLAEDADPAIRSLVASNPSTEPHVLEVLTQDRRPRVRECAARNPSTPPMARKRVFRDRSRRVREAARLGEQALTRSRLADQQQERAHQIRSELRDPYLFAETFATTLARDIADALDLVGNEVDVALTHVSAALAPLRTRRAVLIPVAVSSERHHGTASRILEARRERSQRTWQGNPHAPCLVPLVSNWVEALVERIADPYNLDEASKEVTAGHLTAMFASLGLADPLTEHDVTFIPRWVRARTQPG